MIQRIKKYLNQPFPYPHNKWPQYIFGLSVFVSVFLLIFQPIEIFVPYKHIILLGYGVLAFFVGGLLHLICLNAFPAIFKEDTWTIKRHFIWFAFQFFIIGIANHYYSLLLLPMHPSGINGLLLFQLRAFALGSFPISIHVILFHNILLNKYIVEIKEINNHIATPLTSTIANGKICFVADNEKDKLEIQISELCFVESVGNYIQIYFIKNGVIKNSLLRCSLKRAEFVVSNYRNIVKCHRAYLVNICLVSFVKGNSQGYRLCFTHLDKEIPVARNFSKIVKEQLEAIHN